MHDAARIGAVFLLRLFDLQLALRNGFWMDRPLGV